MHTNSEQNYVHKIFLKEWFFLKKKFEQKNSKKVFFWKKKILIKKKFDALATSAHHKQWEKGISIVRGASGIGVQLTHTARHFPLTHSEEDEEHGRSLQGEYWHWASFEQM